MPSIAFGDEAKVGVVLLHGNGHPTQHIEGLARISESSKFLAAAPEMPWSENRHYEDPVYDAVNQVISALDNPKEPGAMIALGKGNNTAMFCDLEGDKEV